MDSRTIVLRIVGALLALGIMSSDTRLALAQDEIRLFSVAQQDPDLDGNPDLAIISCSFASANDRVTVLDQGDDMIWSEDWTVATDFINDVWIFDVNADTFAELIIAFIPSDDVQMAYFYDDQDGDKRVSYQLIDTEVEITESEYWTVRVEAPDNWYLPDGALNLNLTFTFDGPRSAPGTWGLNIRTQSLILDGAPDWERKIVDSDWDGAPETSVHRLLAQSPPAWTLVRAGARVNMGGRKSAPLPNAIFWPFLRSMDSLPPHNYFDFVPSVSVDWSNAIVEEADVSGYPIETGYHIASFVNWTEDQVSNADFENPQAYYDLANDRDNRPELHVRLHHSNPGAYFAPPHGVLSTPLNEIRYSWNQSNTPNLRWDYKVGLAGRHSIDTVVDIQGFQVRSVPYAQLPAWVITRTWDYGTFVANEELPGESSEGIYAWAPVFYANLYNNLPLFEGNQLFDPEAIRVFPLHYTGLTDQPLAPFFNDILPGLRGEYNFDLNGQVHLYFSPVDRRLHLLGAQKGIWNLADDNGRIEYQNTDQDEYIDQWTYWVDGVSLKSLSVSHGWLVLGTENEITLSHAESPESLFVTLPPVTYEQWAALGERLRANHRDLDPTDLEAMVTQFGAPTSRIEGATLRDFRITSGGFRFVLELSPGFRVVDGEDWLGIREFSPGDYVVSYDEAFRVQPLSPAILRIEPPIDPWGVKQPTAYIPQEVRFTLSNVGLEDALSVVVTGTASSVGREFASLGTQTVTVLAGETVPVRFAWTPGGAGTWRVQAEARMVVPEKPSGSLVVAEGTFEVLPAEEMGLREAVTASGLVPPVAILLLLIATVVVACVGVVALFRHVRFE